ncbi:hypothetical protein Q7P35_004414 [Cladosporium inversicolor]
MRPLLASWATALLYATTTSAQNTSSQDATEFALLYGYPLLAFQKASAARVQQFGVNELAFTRTLSNATARQVVKPNADTLYGNVIYDLSQDDVAITVPDIPDSAFCLFSFYDPFGDNWANIGTGNSAGAGEYRLRIRRTDSGVEAGREMSGNTVNYINSPSLHGVLLIRWLVNATNLDAVHAHQDATKVEGVPKENRSLRGTSLSMFNWNLGNSTPAEHVLNLLAQFAPSNSPEDAAEVDRVDATLTEAGITSGTYGATDADLTAANTSALKTAATDTSSSLTILNNGWTTLQTNKTGDFGTNYGIRAAIASSGYLMLKAPNAVYPSWSNSSGEQTALAGAANLNLGPGESYIYTFAGKPPLKAAGFWSLTAYGADDYFIDTPQSVYALGDRSNITYASGARVYGDDGAEDGEFQILVQPADVAPPANWTSNWLPGPPGGGNMSALLRWYGADEPLLDGSYQYPVVTKQASFTSGGENGTNGTSDQSAPFDGSASGGFGASVLAAVLTVASLGLAAFL